MFASYKAEMKKKVVEYIPDPVMREQYFQQFGIYYKPDEVEKNKDSGKNDRINALRKQFNPHGESDLRKKLVKEGIIQHESELKNVDSLMLSAYDSEKVAFWAENQDPPTSQTPSEKHMLFKLIND